MELPIIFSIIIIILIIILATYNSLVKKRNAVRQSRSTIDVYLNQRFDLIPNLVETVKAYAKHEQNLLETSAKLRTTYEQDKKLETASKLNDKMNQLLLTVENYPELKASDNFLNLQKNLSKIEDQLQAARRLYNMVVTAYNTKLQTFPTNIIATLFSFTPDQLFQLEPGKENNIKIDI